MRSTLKFPRPGSAFIASALAMMAAVPVAALAADFTMRSMDLGSPRWWATLAFVQAVILVGYGASSLALWAGWRDGPLATRLTLIQGVLTALLAGNAAYFLGVTAGTLPDIPSMIVAGVAGWGGEKFLTPILQRINDVFSTFIGKGADKT